MAAQSDHPQSVPKNQQFAQQERQVSRTVELGTNRWLLLAVLISYLLFLLLPYTGSVHGWQVLFRTNAEDADMKIAETVFSWLSLFAAGIGTGLVLLTRRTVIANTTYLLSGMSLFASLFSIWMRLQSQNVQHESGLGIGVWFGVAAVILLVFTLSRVVFSRSAQQYEVAEQRAAHYELDAVGQAQQASNLSRGFDTAETNPLLIDDRRKRSHQRDQ